MSHTFRRTKYRERDIEAIERKRKASSLKEKEGLQEIRESKKDSDRYADFYHETEFQPTTLI